MKIIGVDVGGTFTDLVFSDLDTGAIGIHKVSTTPDDPSRGVHAGRIELCAASGVAPAEIDLRLPRRPPPRPTPCSRTRAS